MNRLVGTALSVFTLVAATACMSPPTKLDLSLTRASVQERYVVTLQPPATPAAINQLHSWQVQVASSKGAPVAHARIMVDGGMPQHGHGLPTRPQVTQELPGGLYLIEGMKFSMTGWWEIKLAIDSPEGADKVTFNTIVAQAASGQLATGANRWSDEDKAVLASLNLKRLPAPPVDPSNAVEQLPAAVELGERLFNDARFSSNGAVSCATCHDPQKQFQDGLPVGHGVGAGSRRSMPIVGAGYGSWLFWDGRKDSLWAQALGPLEDALEHGGNRTRYAHLIAAHYRTEYESLFGAMPQTNGLPGEAGPNGSAAEKAVWAAMTVRQRADVSRVFSNIGKAIAAYEKSLQHQPSLLDHYIDAVLRNDPAAQQILRSDEVKGLRLFIGKAQCVTCHNGPLLTDQQFHNTGVPPRDPARPDRGRAVATAKVLGDEFNCLGPFSDAQLKQCQELRFMESGDPSMEGAFKTPGLRGVAMRPPYMHAGQFASLDEVVRHYVVAPHAAVGHSELQHAHAQEAGNTGSHTAREPIRLSAQEQQDLVAFLRALSVAAQTRTLALPAPKAGRGRPLVVVIADNAGTETTDFVIPYSVLKESGAADVVTVSTGTGVVQLIPALRVHTDMTVAEFDAGVPTGADMVIVPAMSNNKSPALVGWVRSQSRKGAMVVAICEGARVLAHAGLLKGKAATTHWSALKSNASDFPGTIWVRDRRYVADGQVMTTAGVSASIPASLALVEAIAGRELAQVTAQHLGIPSWGTAHDTSAFAFTLGRVSVAATNWLAWWGHETVEIPVQDGFDEVAVALTADAWSRTFRSKALATHSTHLVRSRRGLMLEADAPPKAARSVHVAEGEPPAHALPVAMRQIAQRYGRATADFVAVQLEYPQP